ncbi:hypothetical protein D7D52_03085 [Nocardia yunnanensis]|uniref:Large secreted protein n=1 Tax=Nocardia yunnanensis TaxID=2382165 RepID=A0A386Z5Z4_9NOCA|nr:hypothetical protein [Nocardia yunnanensis]AYF73016.1 hypothetical protein D7D52_03085 [Nocardia yunnanensis]
MYGTRARRLIAATGAALLGLTLAACGSSDGSGGQSKTSTAATSTADAPTEAPNGQIGRPFTADPTIVSPHSIPFDSWTRLGADKIAVNFQTGSPECYGIDATVVENSTSVTVDLKSGTLPNAVGKMCTMIAVFGTLEIQLKAPLADRKVLSAK